MEHKVSIIILNWNGIKDTLECLRSVYKLDYSNFEVIVVDNGSTDNSVQLIRSSFPKVIIIENKANLGYAGGNNTGMRYAMDTDAKFFWLLNNDTVVEPDSLSELILAAGKSPRCGLLSPVIYFYDEPEAVQFCGSILDWSKRDFIHFRDVMSLKNNIITNDLVLWGTALLVSRQVVMSAGYLNEDYFSYHEDIEYSVRAINSGYTNMVVSAARIYHKEARSSGGRESPMHCYYMTRNIYYFWRDNLRGLDKISCLRHYLSDSVSLAGSLKKKKKPDSANACLDAVWSALRNIKGPWDRDIRMPSLIKRILLAYPIFWVYLLRGGFRRNRNLCA